MQQLEITHLYLRHQLKLPARVGSNQGILWVLESGHPVFVTLRVEQSNCYSSDLGLVSCGEFFLHKMLTCLPL